MKSVKAFAPGNISCIFVIKKGKKPEKSGSLGLGFTVNKGVFATIKKLYNGEKTNNQKNKNIKNKIYYNSQDLQAGNLRFQYNVQLYQG